MHRDIPGDLQLQEHRHRADVHGAGSGSSGNILKTFTVHPQLGYEYLAPLGQEDVIKGGGTFCVQLTAQAGVNVRGYVKVEE